MSRYECPNCDGGFPELPPDKECPWCGQSMDKSYSTTPGFEPIFDEADVDPLTDRANGDLVEMDKYISNTTNGVRDLNSNANRTPCPDCGEPMAMVTWTGQKPKCDECRRKDNSSITGDTA